VMVGEPTLRRLILEKLRVTYMRCSLGRADWAKEKIIANHAKFFVVDDIAYYIGSQNLYIANLAEWGLIVDDEAQTRKVLQEYWEPVWKCSYKQDPLDCDVEKVIHSLHIDRNGKDAKDYTADELVHAERMMYTNNGGGTAKGLSLAILCKKASNLKNADRFSKSDPYVDFKLVDATGKSIKGHVRTTTISENLNPEWDEVLFLEALRTPMEYMLQIKVFDEDNILGAVSLANDDLLGEVCVPLNTLKNSGEFQPLQLTLAGGKQRRCCSSGKFQVSKLDIALNTLGEWGL